MFIPQSSQDAAIQMLSQKVPWVEIKDIFQKQVCKSYPLPVPQTDAPEDNTIFFLLSCPEAQYMHNHC